jgi:cell wall-associated NlpC family hydrolase
MRHTWLTRAVLAAAAVSVPVTAVAGTAQAATESQQKVVSASSQVRALVLQTTAKKQVATYNQVAAAVAKRLVGDPYAYGGTSPAGFDCSGLTQWVYRHTGGGKKIPRMAEDQFHQFRRISHAAAHPGDLVFFHDTSNLSSFVYHVGVYEGGNMMVAATVPGEGVQLQSFTWGGDTISFGTITH